VVKARDNYLILGADSIPWHLEKVFTGGWGCLSNVEACPPLRGAVSKRKGKENEQGAGTSRQKDETDAQ